MGLIISIIIAIITASSIKGKVRANEKFSGVAWGLLNGIFGVGFIPVLIARSDIMKSIDQCELVYYSEKAKSEMRSFTITYVICLAIWLTIIIASYATTGSYY